MARAIILHSHAHRLPGGSGQGVVSVLSTCAARFETKNTVLLQDYSPAH